MAFHDFLGNAPILRTVRRQLENWSFPHSVLFSGIEGIGKWTLAQFLAKAMNCTRLQNDFCDHCPPCRRISENTHPDFRNVIPDGQFIKIDQMRDLSREVFFKPFESRQRMFIIDEAERLRDEAANSILKTLEEPPETSILILVTSRPNDLLPTIRSRCQHFRFSPLPAADIDQLLKRRTQHSSEDCRLLAKIAAGSFGRALTIELADYRRHREEMLKLIEACSPGFLYSNAAKAVANWLDKRKSEYFDDRTEILFTLLRDLYLLKVDPDFSAITHLDVRTRLLKLSSQFSLAQLAQTTQVLDHLEAGARRNLNRSLAVDQLVLNLAGVVREPHFTRLERK
jgi:DNA polymerase-3 subunit delta'